MSVWVLGAALVAAGAEAEAPKIDPRIKSVIEKTGPAIDVCVAAYLTDQPSARGTAQVVTTHGLSGEVLIANVDTKLPKPRRLASCLDGVARRWTLPPLQNDRGKLEIVVAVYPGAKFDLDPPKPEPAPELEAPPRPLGDFTFTPGGFVNSEWGGGGGGALPGEAPETGQGTGAAPDEGQGTGTAPEEGQGTGAAPDEPLDTGEAPEEGLGTGEPGPE
ncbi:MAG: hypothetical protein AAFZ18_05525 [Myxococcota bacterium]